MVAMTNLQQHIKPASDPDAGIMWWRHSFADGHVRQYCSARTELTPHWCHRHRWAVSDPCCQDPEQLQLPGVA